MRLFMHVVELAGTLIFSARGWMHVQAELCMSVLGSSIALLSGQKPPFR